MSEYWKHIIEIEKVKKEADQLMMKKIDHYEKELALVREQAQIDTLEKDSIEKLSGNWYLDKGFAYHQIEYVQLVNDKGDKAYSDVVTIINNVYYEGKKIDISESVKKDSYFNLKYAVELNCKK